jgi:hypothetical protein
VIVKVYVKSGTQKDNDKVKTTEGQLTGNYWNQPHTECSAIRDIIKTYGIPNVYPFQTFVDTEKASYMLRQYFHNNLYDRIR